MRAQFSRCYVPESPRKSTGLMPASPALDQMPVSLPLLHQISYETPRVGTERSHACLIVEDEELGLWPTYSFCSTNE